LKLVLAPAASTMGKLNPLIVNPVPVTLTVVRLRLAVPLLVTVSGSTWRVPTATVPNARLVDDAVSCAVAGGGVVLDFALKPWQPIIAISRVTMATTIRVRWGICLIKWPRQLASHQSPDSASMR
jgi:hypothetical protein